jgi:signal transduction histidine kinase
MPSPAPTIPPPLAATARRRESLPAGAFRSHAAETDRRSFFRVVSHELRTPLNAIIGFSEIIARELYGPLSEPRYREHAELVRESGLKLLKLVNDVLDIARLDSGAADLDLRPENLSAAAEEAVRVSNPDAEARGVRIVLTVPDTAPRAMADARGLATILSNLLENAIAHAPEGSDVEIVVAGDHEGTSVQICDHGQGVDPSDLGRIQRPFEQVEDPLVRRTDGAGLGLTIVGLLCKAMDARLVLCSAKGEGFSATVHLPPVPQPQAV